MAALADALQARAHAKLKADADSKAMQSAARDLPCLRAMVDACIAEADSGNFSVVLERNWNGWRVDRRYPIQARSAPCYVSREHVWEHFSGLGFSLDVALDSLEYPALRVSWDKTPSVSK